jgi:hypothetical protein
MSIASDIHCAGLLAIAPTWWRWWPPRRELPLLDHVHRVWPGAIRESGLVPFAGLPHRVRLTVGWLTPRVAGLPGHIQRLLAGRVGWGHTGGVLTAGGSRRSRARVACRGSRLSPLAWPGCVACLSRPPLVSPPPARPFPQLKRNPQASPGPSRADEKASRGRHRRITIDWKASREASWQHHNRLYGVTWVPCWRHNRTPLPDAAREL